MESAVLKPFVKFISAFLVSSKGDNSGRMPELEAGLYSIN